MDLPSKDKKIFIETGKVGELGIVGQSDTSSQFYYYTVGYLEAANSIIKTLLRKQKKEEAKISYQTQEDLNCAVLPVCFLYRQYLELALKDIYLQYSNDTREAKTAFLNSASHKLCEIWNSAKPVLESVIEGKDEEFALENLDAYIKEFNEKDPTSFSFRYPIDKELNCIHLTETKINLRNLMRRMNEIESFLSSVLPLLDIEKDILQSNNYRQEAILQRDNEKFELALKLFDKSMLIRIKFQGDNHPDIAILHIDIAHTCLLMRDFKNALAHYFNAIKLIEEGTSEKFPSLFIPYRKIGLIYEIQEDFKKAIEFYEKAIIVSDREWGEKNPRTLELKEDIATIKNKSCLNCGRFAEGGMGVV